MGSQERGREGWWACLLGGWAANGIKMVLWQDGFSEKGKEGLVGVFVGGFGG